MDVKRGHPATIGSVSRGLWLRERAFAASCDLYHGDQSPVEPSMVSRMMSAWPRWRDISMIMWSMTPEGGLLQSRLRVAGEVVQARSGDDRAGAFDLVDEERAYVLGRSVSEVEVELRVLVGPGEVDVFAGELTPEPPLMVVRRVFQDPEEREAGRGRGTAEIFLGKAATFRSMIVHL